MTWVDTRHNGQSFTRQQLGTLVTGLIHHCDPLIINVFHCYHSGMCLGKETP